MRLWGHVAGEVTSCPCSSTNSSLWPFSISPLRCPLLPRPVSLWPCPNLSALPLQCIGVLPLPSLCLLALVFLLLALPMPSCCIAPSHPGLSRCSHAPISPLCHCLTPPVAAPHHLCHLPSGQCAIPAFEDLLGDDHNKRLLKLLYWTAEWHGLAKLRLHTWAILDHLESLTKEYGHLMRSFRDLTCSQFETKELQWEVDAWKRAQQHAQARGSSKGSQSISEWWKKTFNLFMLKFHALGDYICTIQIFGTTDLFSTQVVWNSYHVINIYVLKMNRVN